MTKKILITGAKGFFGTRFINRYQGEFEILGLDVEQLDITDNQAVVATFADFQPDYVIHAAAIAVTDFCNKHPDVAHKVNVQGAINVAKACKEHGAKLVFISTEQVFNGNPEKGPYSELDQPVPDTVYGQNKLEAEKELASILDEMWVLRFTWLFGLPERNTTINPNVVWNTLQALVNGQVMQERRNEFRGLTYVHELIEQFPKIFTIPYGTYHTGAHNPASRYEIAEHILTELGQQERLNELLEAADAPKTRDVRLDTSKLADQGVVFTESKDALTKCLKEFNFI
ncbi:TPA: NAD(P)-dependent oxidoreductase [Vibrio parahaemolyticus]|uniref:SDR family oxidoreductase n=1 Tax=Vibrio parahaemolyticus TaxID=670 RepID=UPI00235F711E|nr:NAD(P)-dependent oxidoreductase [Vibrio parahaemolyticus]HCH5588620.1 NAD(P)-dependent oxidoreductase [Vibrio parahaemolyticus]HDU8573933.1 NAD(P)-dependent oxidoreductase [Vibrio parahaemolyticus]